MYRTSTLRKKAGIISLIICTVSLIYSQSKRKRFLPERTKEKARKVDDYDHIIIHKTCSRKPSEKLFSLNLARAKDTTAT